MHGFRSSLTYFAIAGPAPITFHGTLGDYLGAADLGGRPINFPDRRFGTIERRGPTSFAPLVNPWRQVGTDLPNRSQILQVSPRLASAAMPDYLVGKFNSGCAAADSCREPPFLAAIVQELTAAAHPRQASDGAAC